jgi:hypothetical protein
MEIVTMKTIVKWISHNQGLFVALLISIGLLVWSFGCQSKVGSLIEADKQVTREELQLELDSEVGRLEAELDILSKQAAVKFGELDRQDEIKRKLFEFASITAQAGTLNPAGIIALAGSILGFGAIIDNRIKDKVIRNRPLNKAATT